MSLGISFTFTNLSHKNINLSLHWIYVEKLNII